MDRISHAIEALGSEVFGVLGRGIPARLVEISRSGCLLESRHPVDVGVVGELRLESGGDRIADDVRVTRCVRVEGSGSSYLVGAEFVQTRRAGEGSIRRAVSGILRRAIPDKALAARKLWRTEGTALAATPLVGQTPTGEGDVMREVFARLVREDEGQDIIEYALLAGLITTGVVTFITTIGARVLAMFTELSTAIAE